MNRLDRGVRPRYPRGALPFRRAILLSAALTVLLGAAALTAACPRAVADPTTCARTDSPTPASPTPGQPCWTEVTPYPFGSDGNPVDPSSGTCGDHQFSRFGPNWTGDFNGTAGGSAPPPCYLETTSMAFRAWNRGLAATEQPDSTFASTNAFGVWLFNGTRWFPDPTFPGASSCPGSTVLWAGKLDYWLIGPGEGDHVSTNGQTLCRFDGVNFEWEVLKLPQATLARFPVSPNPRDPNNNPPLGGINAGACYAWDNCWFFGTYGAVVHWDGQVLSDASPGLATTPWLEGDFTGAVANTDPSGNPFGLAITGTSADPLGVPPGPDPLPAQPDGSPPAQVFSSQGGPFAPLSFSPPATARPDDPYTTDLVAVDFDSQGDGWVAGDPATRETAQSQPAPLLRLTRDGAAAPCAGYDANTFTASGNTGTLDVQWNSLSVFPNDGSALAGASFAREPALVHASCGVAPAVTRFRIPDPFNANQASAAPVPADPNSQKTSVAANASNDAWAAAEAGTDTGPPPNSLLVYLRPRLYHLTDGDPPDAPAGDDFESRPSLFTLDPPVFVAQPPVVVVVPPSKTVHKRSKRTTKRLKPAVYDVKTKVSRASGGTLTLYVTFRVRRAVTIGVEALRGRKVVSSSGLKRFTGHRGRLAMKLDRRRWPTAIRFVSPRKKRR